MIKKVMWLLGFFLLFSCKHKAEEVNQTNQKVYIKSMSVASQAVDIEEWKVTVPYNSKALELGDFDVVLSFPNASFSISPLPLKISAGKSAKVVVTSNQLSQEVEITMRNEEHTVNFVNPSDGFLVIRDEESKPITTGAKVVDGTVLTLSATPHVEPFVVDYYKINGKRCLWGKTDVEFEVKEDLNIEVSFIERHRFSCVSVVDEHLVISKDKWLDYLGWEDSPDVHVEPFAIGRTEVPYHVWKEILTWAEEHGYKFNNEGANGSRFVSDRDVKPFDENDGKFYPAVRMSQIDAWAWCNALVDYMNEKYRSEAGYVPLTHVYKIRESGKEVPLKDVRVDFPQFQNPPPSTIYQALQKAIDFINSIIIDVDATGYRLPTRYEWIVAGRGGDPKAPAWDFRYPGSNVLSEITNFHIKGQGLLKTQHPICSKKPNTLGLYDMFGNADEWIDTVPIINPLTAENIGHSSFDDEDEFNKDGWFQQYRPTGSPAWGGIGTFGGGTYGFGATGFRLAFSIR